MFRLVALSRAIQAAVPPVLYPVFDVITTVGGTEFLLFFLAALYWIGPRRETVVVISLTFVTLSTILVLKYGLALPRPPETMRLVRLESGPFGFPSGHAMASTVVYGGLAVRYDVDQPLRWYSLAGIVVALVALSRVVLGVHYVGDVLAGILFGSALLFVLPRFVEKQPQRGFAIAAVLAVPGIFLTNYHTIGFMALGGPLGGSIACSHVKSIPTIDTWRHRAILASGGVFLTAIGVVTLRRIDAFPPVAVVGYALLVAGILLLPALSSSLIDATSA